MLILVAAELLLVIASAFLLFWVWMVAQHFAVPYVPTKRRVIDATLDALKLGDATSLYDMGSGDGRVVIAALMKYRKLRGVGVEARHGFVALSRITAWMRGISGRAKFKTGDLFDIDLSKETHVYAFLSHPMMARLEPKFEKELKSARLVSLGFPLPKRRPTETIELEHGSKHYNKLYVYEYGSGNP